MDKRLHIEKCFRPAEALMYCMKESTRQAGPWEFGTRPIFNEQRKDKWKQTKELAIAKKFDEIDPAMYIKYAKSLHFIADKNQSLGEPYEHCRGIWIYGPSGCGKTSKAQLDFNGAFYYKAKDKWWCGYTD